MTLLLSACSSVENIAYMQQVTKQLKDSESTNNLSYEARIKPKDLLSITVVSNRARGLSYL